MISVKNIGTYGDIPDEWIFEYYLNLKEPLIGQDLKILSVFNSHDKIPSMCIYYDIERNKYKFKDFSSGKNGDALDLIMELYNIKYIEAILKIKGDYEKTPPLEKKVYLKHDRFKITDYEVRHWNVEDKKYWTKFKLDSKLLEKYNVAPLSFYVMSKEALDGTVESFKKSHQNIYGYFNNENELIKIYQPLLKDQKFIKVRNYLQGSDQLTFKTKYLIITSSLKDLMCFQKLGITNIESVAPDSENSMISKNIMESFISKYKKVFILFDNDEPGKRSADKYVELYDCIKVELNMSKDLSDSVKDYGLLTIKTTLFNTLKKLIL